MRPYGCGNGEGVREVRSFDDNLPEDTNASPLKEVRVSPHETTLIYFEGRVETYGLVRIQTWHDGIQVWIGGELRYNGKKKMGEVTP
jgi:hypothetical protein